MRHQAFESEIAANKPRLETLQKDGHGLVDEKPDSGEVVSSLSGNINRVLYYISC